MGISNEAITSIAASSMFGALTDLVIIIIALGFLYVVLRMVVFGTESNQHRKMLTNLYVSGKIRQLAKKDDIDLNSEMKELLKTIKEQRRYNKPLDDVIEFELQDKIIEESKSSKK